MHNGIPTCTANNLSPIGNFCGRRKERKNQRKNLWPKELGTKGSGREGERERIVFVKGKFVTLCLSVKEDRRKKVSIT